MTITGTDKKIHYFYFSDNIQPFKITTGNRDALISRIFINDFFSDS